MMRNGISKSVLPRIVALMLICVLLLALFPASIPAHAAVKDEKTIVVSMGDSFSSGEGIEKFYYQDLPLDEKIYKDDWLAHRSQKSWPGKLKVPGLEGTLADNKDNGWYFVASSGAVTSDVTGKNEGGKIVGQKKKVITSDDEVLRDMNLAPQLDIFTKIDAQEVDYVTITMGGNDAGFSSIIKTAAMDDIPFLESGRFSDILDTAMGKERSILESLSDVYDKISIAAPNAEIIVAGYPRLLDMYPDVTFLVGVGTCVFSPWEAMEINNAVDYFNGKISSLVRSCNKSGKKIHFVSVDNLHIPLSDLY